MRPSQDAASVPDTGDEVEASSTTKVPAPSTPAPPPPVHHGPSVVHHPIPAADLDPEAVKILRRLTRFDHTAYLVGGCVRDLLLERRPKDFDIATSATPRQVKRLFSNCRIIGRRFRLAHIYFQNGKIIEVATFRARDEVDDNEPHPDQDLLIRDDNVFGTPEEDALRRDFTMNALFYDVNAETVIDHAEGLGDLRRKLVRTIGDPGIRFREDPIRILRAIKFAARLDLGIEAETLAALKRLRHEIPKAAPARVLEEINRFCRGGASRASFDLLQETGVLEVILPEFAEAYGNDPGAVALRTALFGAMDRRCAEGREPQMAEILATLVLPLVVPAMGWSGDGNQASRRGLDMRAMADHYVRPMALRLRVSRKDQEGCRQILMALYRMVPGHPGKRAQRESMRRRPYFAQALWMLSGASALVGGEVAAAESSWRAEGEAPAPVRGSEPREERTTETDEPDAGPQGERRRRRRRSRRRGGSHAPAIPASAEAPRTGGTLREAPPSEPALPPVWDDRYFFAALPTASQVDASADQGDRYGAATVVNGIAAAAPEGGNGELGAPEAAPRPKRSRRRRPRRSGAADPGSRGTSESV